ncbi:MAG: M15 family metallopeptidase [bacterium]
MNPADNKSSHHLISRRVVLGTLGTLILFAGAVGASEYRNKILVEEMASTTRSFIYRITDAENKTTELTTRVAGIENVIINQQNRSAQIDEQLGKVNSTVSTLDKLSKTDPQLLQKYSKVYFLNENYIPAKLSFINTEYLANSDRPLQIHTDVLPYLQRMIESSKSDGMSIKVQSAYRSFGQQAQLKSSYKIQYGTSAANSFSADQGYSEHQLGTTMDFTTVKNGEVLDRFASAPEYQWMVNNAFKYGFALSYPPNNKYYIYEPWHWRFVGVDLATKLHNEGKYFYDLDQRDINTFLVSLFS